MMIIIKEKKEKHDYILYYSPIKYNFLMKY